MIVHLHIVVLLFDVLHLQVREVTAVGVSLRAVYVKRNVSQCSGLLDTVHCEVTNTLYTLPATYCTHSIHTVQIND